ncbi:MAG: hypothetical protein AAGA44_17460 [Pseudomonadota bacterium]
MTPALEGQTARWPLPIDAMVLQPSAEPPLDTDQGPALWQREARWAASGRFLTSSGVSAGIDMSLAVTERFFGLSVARMIAVATEYEWNEDASRDPFVKHANSAVPYVDMLRDSFAE